ncbi:G-rich sequence factor 1 isoform X2 [Cheilinus undulatus]|uniref:G-rich sequence factor 1 isoform X2 n=1 Tax=Cheilinus undulatus TaxID=241271 RepID=UPI001BD3176F|nr:G-rich sequence factor 1 isoform X2 [Cheilinus undulatus]
MSSKSKALFLLQRCVAVGQVTLSTGIKKRSSVLPARFIQQRSLTLTSRIVCVPRLCELQPVNKTSKYSFCTKTGASSDDEYPPLPTYQPDSEQKKEVYIVQVKGLLWSCTAQDLLQFFSDCRIRDGENGIHLTLDWLGRPSGRAFIELEHEEDVSKALEKHRQYLGPRYLEVYEVTNSDAEEILKKDIQTPAEGGVVKLRGLPYSSTEADITQFFSDYKGRNSGEAYVQFSSQEAADEALLRDREVIGNRYIEVFPSNKAERYPRLRKRMRFASPQSSSQMTNRKNVSESQTNPGTEPTRSSPPQLNYIHVRGLPFQVSGEDIVEFFSPLIVTKILLECGPDGRPSGEADVYFGCHQDAIAAMSKDRQNIGERYIELFLNSAPDSNRR